MLSLPRRASARHARRLALPFLVAAPFAIAATPAQAETVRLTTVGCHGVDDVENSWTVPADVTSIRLTAHGAQGGGTGGQGQWLHSNTVSVTPGETLYACVGVGGGRGGAGAAGAPDGYDGGGYTSVSRNADHSAPLMLAAGGGGRGGAMGTVAAPAGGTAVSPDGSGGGAGGAYGMATGGGAASATDPGVGGVNIGDPGTFGEGGASLRGGAGGRGSMGAPGGGGGGAGFRGGGGGAGGNTVSDGDGGGAGGGGGISTCSLTPCSTSYQGGVAYVDISFTVPQTTTTTVTSDPASPLRGSAVVYTARVDPVPTGGHVAFNVDGYDLPQCSAQVVSTTTGEATCNTMAPWQPGLTPITARYTGAGDFRASEGRADITVRGAKATLTPEALAFGDVVVGRTADLTVTLTSTGDADLVVGDNAFELFQPEDFDFAPRGATRAAPPRAVGYAVVDDQCADRVLAPTERCTVTIRFSPERLGEHPAELWVGTNAWDHAEAEVSGNGVVAPPEPRPEPQPEPQPQPQPRPDPQPQPKPVEPKPDPAPAARGAFASPSAVSRGALVSQSGGLRLPLVCPAGQPCRVSGTLSLAITGGQARVAQSTTSRVLVRFSGVRIAAGRTRGLSLRLPASFVKAQQRKGVRKLRTTLTVRTTLGSGRTITERQQLTLIIPRARAAQRRAPAARRPSFTG